MSSTFSSSWLEWPATSVSSTISTPDTSGRRLLLYPVLLTVILINPCCSRYWRISSNSLFCGLRTASLGSIASHYSNPRNSLRRHNINTGMFLASLSVAELLLLVVYLPLEFTKDILTQEVRGGEVCKLKEFIKMLTALASVINLAAVSFER